MFAQSHFGGYLSPEVCCLTELLLLSMIKIEKGRLIGFVRSGQKHKRKKADKPTKIGKKN